MRFAVAALALAFVVASVARSAGAEAPAPLGSPAPAPAAADALAAAVDARSEAIVGAKNVPGLAVAVERHGEVVFERGYGLADRSRNLAATADTRFEIGSITKQITAACIMQLVEAGRISLDDHLGTYVSDYFVGRGVTIRQMLEQVSGIPEFLKGDDVVTAAGTEPATYATLLERVSAKPLDFAPGTRWEYSNTNYILLGRIIELVSRQSYEDYVRAHVFAPAGMTQSGFIDDETKLPAMARGYEGTSKGAQPAPPLRADWAASAGAIVSTVGDLIKWDDAFTSGKIVKPADAALMREPAKLADGSSTSYGFGWIADTLDGHPRVWHNGGTFGYYAVNATFPGDGETIVVLTNSTLPAADTLLRDAFAALHSDVAPSTSVPTPAPGEDPTVTKLARDTLQQFETDDLDRTKLSDAMSRALTPDELAAVKAQFAPLGSPQSLIYRGAQSVGALTVYTYRAAFAAGTFSIVITLDADRKIAGYYVRPQ
jgi:CubicO group peptidase (beta-lactamase class C family)